MRLEELFAYNTCDHFRSQNELVDITADIKGRDLLILG